MSSFVAISSSLKVIVSDLPRFAHRPMNNHFYIWRALYEHVKGTFMEDIDPTRARNAAVGVRLTVAATNWRMNLGARPGGGGALTAPTEAKASGPGAVFTSATVSPVHALALTRLRP